MKGEGGKKYLCIYSEIHGNMLSTGLKKQWKCSIILLEERGEVFRSSKSGIYPGFKDILNKILLDFCNLKIITSDTNSILKDVEIKVCDSSLRWFLY